VFPPPFTSNTVIQAFWWHPFNAEDRAHLHAIAAAFENF
jgi:hypothetical protein